MDARFSESDHHEQAFRFAESRVVLICRMLQETLRKYDIGRVYDCWDNVQSLPVMGEYGVSIYAIRFDLAFRLRVVLVHLAADVCHCCCNMQCLWICVAWVRQCWRGVIFWFVFWCLFCFLLSLSFWFLNNVALQVTQMDSGVVNSLKPSGTPSWNMYQHHLIALPILRWLGLA